MPIDTARKRQLIIAFGNVWYPPSPTYTGHTDKSDRKAICWNYTGVQEEEEDLEMLVDRAVGISLAGP